MPLPDDALIDTLNAMRQAIAATANVASASSEVARQEFATIATDRLNDVMTKLAELHRVAHEHPPLFGQHVGDGLDVERGQARVAIDFLRQVMANGGRVQLFAFGWVFFPGDRFGITKEHAALLDALDVPPKTEG